jgi:predicted DNA-binding transcriptional regulator YafY
MDPVRAPFCLRRDRATLAGDIIPENGRDGKRRAQTAGKMPPREGTRKRQL